jgi:hypothetical protein
MSYSAWQAQAAEHAPADERAEFIRKTYAHLGVAVLACAALSYGLVNSALAPRMLEWIGASQFSWLLVLGAFMLASTVAQRWAQSGGSVSKQYLGLGLYVVAQSIIFTPLLFVAAFYTDANVLPTAGILSTAIFGGLTVSVFVTKKDFSFMQRALSLAGFAAMGLIVASILFGFTLGTLFSAAMIVLMAGYILYYTSNVLHHYPVGAHVAASLALFAALATLFWYVLQFVMDRD